MLRLTHMFHANPRSFGTVERPKVLKYFVYQRHSSSHIRSVLSGVEYQNCCRILDAYLLFVVWMGQVQNWFTYL